MAQPPWWWRSTSVANVSPVLALIRSADGANSPLDFRLRASQPGRCSVLGAGSIPRWGFTWHSRRAAELSIFLAHIVAAGKGTGVFSKDNLAGQMIERRGGR